MNLPKASVFIDGSNIYFAQKRSGVWLDWVKVKTYLQEKYSLREIYYFIGIRKNDVNVLPFIKKLNKIGFQVITKDVKTIIDETGRKLEKANFDVEITADAILSLEETDIVILFSGDSDFNYLAKIVRQSGKQIVVFSSRKTLSWELKLAANKHLLIENLRELTKNESFAKLL